MSNWTTVNGMLYATHCDSRLRTGEKVLKEFVNKYKYLIPKGSEDTVNIKVIGDCAITGAYWHHNKEEADYYYGNAVIVIFGCLRDVDVAHMTLGFRKFARQLRKEHGVRLGTFIAQDYYNTVTFRILNDKFENLSDENWYKDLSAEEIRMLDLLPF